MLSAASRPYIDASVPVLREHGLAITTHFYREMFAARPELTRLFNMGNQANGAQQQSLASAVFAYAANVDRADVLAPVVERIVHKHVAVGLTSAHYPIVGKHLLEAIAAVLGDAATPPLMAAWDEAYWLLAGELIAAEARLYDRHNVKAGELQAVRVVRRENEGDAVVALTLAAEDGTPLRDFAPGQYISVEANFPDGGRQLRQYSLSAERGVATWRISVKREAGNAETPAGAVSNWLHDTARVGTTLNVSTPWGDFAPALAGTHADGADVGRYRHHADDLRCCARWRWRTRTARCCSPTPRAMAVTTPIARTWPGRASACPTCVPISATRRPRRATWPGTTTITSARCRSTRC